MKRFLLSVFCILSIMGYAVADEAKFDFTAPSGLTPSITDDMFSDGGNGALAFNTDETTFTANGVTLNTTKGSMDSRIWKAAKGTYDYRVYKTATMTIAAPEGGVITAIAFDGSTVSSFSANSGTVDGKNWTGAATSVVFTWADDAKTQKINTITVTFSTDGSVTPDQGEGEGEGEGGGATEESVYINETFASDFGVFSTAETVGETPWIIDYKTAKATSYIDGTNNPATSWLISSPVDFTEETEAYVAFEYIIRYSESGKVADNHQLLISADYAGDPAAATWTDLPYGAVEGTDWTTFYKANVAVPAEFLGKNGVTFALRYTATTKASTWEVRNFVVAHGTAAEPEEPEEAQEYTVSEALAAYVDGQQIPAIVTGYIVGAVKSAPEKDSQFGADATVATNILISDNPDTNDYTECLIVQLPKGDVRSALNLVDNPGNYNKQVKITGSLEKYFNVAGLKSVTAYEFTGTTGIEQITENREQSTVIFDLTGRKVNSITAPGIYIVNGKKVLVK